MTRLPDIGDLALDLSAPLADYLADALASGDASAAVQRLLDAHRCATGLRVGEILSAVCAHYGVARMDVLSQRRTTRLVAPRFMTAYLARLLTTRSLTQIGHAMGRRDHTTILSAIRKMRARIAVDPAFARDADTLITQLYSTRTNHDEHCPTRSRQADELAARSPAYAQGQRGL